MRKNPNSIPPIISLAISVAVLGVQSQAAYIGWGVGPGGTLAKTTDGGNTWTSFASNAGFGAFPKPHPDLYAVASPDPNDVWIAGINGTIFRSSDGGATWSQQSSHTNARLNRVDCVDPQSAWAVGLGGALIHTSDGGANWTIQSSGTTNDLDGVSFVDAQNGWAVGQAGTILHTSNGGSTWIAQNSGTTIQLWSVSFTSALDGWAAGLGRTLLHTSDGGATWLAETGPFGPANGNTLGDSLNDLIFLDPLHGWTAGDEGIGRTSDGGHTWTTYLTNQAGFGSMTFLNSQSGWVNDFGVLWLTSDGGNTWTRKNSGFDLYGINFLDSNASPAPEPSTCLLLLAAIPTLLSRRHRQRSNPPLP